ncbi:MAG: metallophosphoesterase family protein [Phycisphaerales bacterium]|nr:metallophosphoesterase family protein [Phycisphaerales bacterium]MCI0631420.1 metallophosphoesterase family protein [Phycisphaerales bacterium]MCI0676970.1 metallophosphoesterase family protein [Phycisphaerales bacterium]
MNRLAIISDIHGNLHALEAVLARISEFDVDGIVCLGDIVGYGPFPERCIDLVVRHCAFMVQGNHEEAVVDPDCAEQMNGAAREAIYWTRENVGPLHLNALNRMPKMAHIGIPGTPGSVMCVHDSPVPGPNDYVHDKQVAAQAFAGVETNICLIGHTHVPMVFEAPTLNPREPLTALELVAYLPNEPLPIRLEPDRRYICNPGSVGQPRDCDPRAAFAILELLVDGQASVFTVHRQSYDIAAAQRETQRAGLPTILADRLALGA